MICYHGTTAEAAELIKRHGFKSDSWFAIRCEDALAFGGPVVLKVEFDDDVIEGVRQRTIADGDEWWQFHVLEVVPPCQIKGDAE